MVHGRASGSRRQQAADAAHVLFSCALCGTHVRMCRSHFRGNRYCSAACGREGRRLSVKKARAKHQSSPRGAQAHARRQAALRSRRRVSPKPAQPTCPPSVARPPVPTPVPTSRVISSMTRCTKCGKALSQQARLHPPHPRDCGWVIRLRPANGPGTMPQVRT